MGVRAATREDVHAIHALIVALATYERAPDSVIATPDDLERALFGASPSVFAHVVEHEGVIVGFALWFTTYSTWLGKHGLWLEDLFVLPEARGRNVGLELLRCSAQRPFWSPAFSGEPGCFKRGWLSRKSRALNGCYSAPCYSLPG